MSVNTSYIVGIIMGTLSLILSQFYTFPQLYQLCKTRNTSGISLWTYIVYIVTSCFWSAWAFGFFFQSINNFDPINSGDKNLYLWNLIPAVIMNTCDITIMCIIISIKIKHIYICKREQITELELANLLTNKLYQESNYKWFKIYWLLITGILVVAIPAIVITLSLVLTANLNYSLGGKQWIWIVVIGVIASITWEIVNWPQFIKTMKVKDTTGISLFWAIFMFTASSVTLCYDFSLAFINKSFSNPDAINLLQVLPGIICSGVLPALAVLILKIINISKAKRLHLTELEYTKQYLIKNK